MDRAALTQMWKSWWVEDIWIAPWSKAVGGLTPQQAAWFPGPGRHSIWQTVNHVVFWRTYTLNVIAGKPKPDAAQVEALQFAGPASPSESAWADARRQLEATHTAIGDALANAAIPDDRLRYHLAHDAYHLGQIMYLRAMQGLAPIV